VAHCFNGVRELSASIAADPGARFDDESSLLLLEESTLSRCAERYESRNSVIQQPAPQGFKSVGRNRTLLRKRGDNRNAPPRWPPCSRGPPARRGAALGGTWRPEMPMGTIELNVTMATMTWSLAA
jgi:hypothetical protein